MPSYTPPEQAERLLKVDKTDKQVMLLTVRLNKDFYDEIDDTAWKFRPTKAHLIRTATEQYLKAIKNAKNLAA